MKFKKQTTLKASIPKLFIAYASIGFREVWHWLTNKPNFLVPKDHGHFSSCFTLICCVFWPKHVVIRSTDYFCRWLTSFLWRLRSCSCFGKQLTRVVTWEFENYLFLPFIDRQCRSGQGGCYSLLLHGWFMIFNIFKEVNFWKIFLCDVWKAWTN